MKFGIPVPLKIGALVLATTALYTYIGQLVPQKEVLPPAEAVISADMGPEQLVEVGREIAENKGICLTCHTIGQGGAGMRFPDLDGIGARAATQIPEMSAVEYLAQSLYEPDAFIVPGYNPGMPVINKGAIGLSDEEIIAVIAWLESLGGEPTVDLETKFVYTQ